MLTAAATLTMINAEVAERIETLGSADVGVFCVGRR
jgi:hypothetical protein